MQWVCKGLLPLLFFTLSATAAELRGVWVARDSLSSRATIAATVETAAANNLNAIYINGWSRGYPLWRSRVFQQHTGIEIDPAYQGRDIIAETIAEAHRLGLEVHVWLEYGFVGGWSGYQAGRSGKGPIFDAHPDWLARDSRGNDAFPSGAGGNYFWMAHTRTDVQQFLLDLLLELSANYDVDGIELDRVRYPQLDCGYDAFTVDLYKSENNGAAPPEPNNTGWMAWRANKLNEFAARAHRELKARRAGVHVSNAPAVYPFAYQNFLQDYPAWLRAGVLDHVTPQVYRRTAAEYTAELQNQLRQAPAEARAKVMPGIDTTAPPSSEVVAMVRANREAGLQGMVFWYFGGMSDDLAALKAEVFQQPDTIPGRVPSWRRDVLVVEAPAIGQPGETITYSVTAPRTGYYEVYAHTTPAAGGAAAARYVLSDSTGASTTTVVDQRSPLNNGWVPVGEVLLQAGQRRAAVRLDSTTGEGTAGGPVLFIRSNRRPVPPPSVRGEAIVNAATFDAASGISPGAIISLFGINLSEQAGVAAGSLPLPTELAGSAVRIGGRPAPLYYVSATQINAHVPWAVGPGTAEVLVTRDGGPSEAVQVPLQAVSPALFAATPQSARRGDYVSVYATGFGPIAPPVPDGAAAAAAPLSHTTAAVEAVLGGVPARVTFSGLAPGFAALYQINFQVPAEAPSGPAGVVLRVQGASSNPLQISVE